MICPNCREFTSWRYKRCPECHAVLPQPEAPEEAPHRPPLPQPAPTADSFGTNPLGTGLAEAEMARYL